MAGVSNGELDLITSYSNKHNIQVTDCRQLYYNRYEPIIKMVVSDDVRSPCEEADDVVDDDVISIIVSTDSFNWCYRKPQKIMKLNQ